MASAKILCIEVATGQPRLQTCQSVERASDLRLQGEELLPEEYSIIVFSTIIPVNWEICETGASKELTALCGDLRFSVSNSIVHIHVATAEFLMHFRMLKICLSFTESDCVTL